MGRGGFIRVQIGCIPDDTNITVEMEVRNLGGGDNTNKSGGRQQRGRRKHNWEGKTAGGVREAGGTQGGTPTGGDERGE